MSRPSREPDHPRRAFVWMAVSGLGFTFMSIFVRRLSTQVPHFELVFFRSFVNCMLAAGLMIALRESFNPPQKWLLLLRGFAGFCGVSCLFFAIGQLGVTVASMLNWLSPIFVILISGLVLKEKLSRRSLVSIAAAFLGLFLLLRPDLAGSAVRLPVTPVLVGILGAVCGGIAYTAVRAATAKVSVNAIIFYFTALSSLLSLPVAMVQFKMPTPGILAECLLVGIFASIGQFAMTHAYRYARASLVSTMSLMNAAFAVIFGWALLGERLAPVQWLGMIVMGVAIASVTLSSAMGHGEVKSMKPVPL